MIAFSLLSLFLPALALAAESNLSLKTAIHEALANSPQLRAQQSRADLAANDRWRRFLFNEPVITYNANDNQSQRQYVLTLPVSFPGKSFALMSLDRARYQSQRAELAARRFDLADHVALAYLECATAEATMDMQTQTVDDLERVFSTLKALYESGHGTQAEKIGAELNSRQARSDLEIARYRETTSCRRFAELWKIESGRDLPTPDLDLPDDLDQEVVRELGAHTAEEARSEAAIRLAQATAATAGWSVAPDLTLSIARNDYTWFPASPNGQRWTTGYGISMTLPLFYPFAEGAEVRRARAQARLDENAAYVERVRAVSDVRQARQEYQHARARLSELRAKDLTLGEALAESTSSAYRAGKLGFAELVLSRKTLADLRAQDINLRSTIIAAHLRCLDQCNGGPE